MRITKPTRILCCQCGSTYSIWPSKVYSNRDLHFVPALNDYAHISCLEREIYEHQQFTGVDMNPLRIILGIMEPEQNE